MVVVLAVPTGTFVELGVVALVVGLDVDGAVDGRLDVDGALDVRLDKLSDEFNDCEGADVT